MQNHENNSIHQEPRPGGAKSSRVPAQGAESWPGAQGTLWEESPAEQELSKAPCLRDYLNFREYLRDYYLFRRKTHQGLRSYSYSVFSAAADIRSPNYLKLIIENKRNLSEEMAGKFAKALQLNKAETAEFRLLVLYGQEKDPLLRNQHLRTLADWRVQQQIESGEIPRESYEQIPDWVSWVLFAMCDQEGAKADPAALSRLFRGKVSEEQVRRALSKLVLEKRLSLEDGELQKSKEDIPRPEVAQALVRKLQAELNYLGMESLFEDSAKVREFGSLTVALTEEEFERYRFELRQLRKRLHKENAVRRGESKGERVYQVNLQLFPLTDSVRK